MCIGVDQADFFAGAWRIARKNHKCCACGEAITAGSRYHYESIGYDGSVTSYKHCARCWIMVDQLMRHTQEPVDLGLNCGEIWEQPPDTVAMLAFMTKDEAQAASLEVRS